MPTHPEATRLNLEYYRKSAKALLKSALSGDAAALERIARHATKSGAPALHQAQLAVAREQGFASWPRFRAFLIESKLDFQGLVNRFVEAAVEDARTARELLAQYAGIARAGLWPSLVLGDTAGIANADAIAKGGPRNWEPLLYVCFSRIAGDRAADAARTLLRNGANPNAFYIDPRWPDGRLSSLYAATGIHNNIELARVLLDAGANPNDGESLYHSTEHADLACFRLLLERGTSAENPNVLNHMLDREEPEGVRLLLEAGASPNGRNGKGDTTLHWAVWRRRSPLVIAMLLDAGAEIDARRKDGRTAYALAKLAGREEVAALLAERGADTGLPPLDSFIAGATSTPPASSDPADYYLLPELVQSHATEAVRKLLEAGVPVDTRGEHGGTALHWACWKGNADIAKMLLDAGASLEARDETYSGTPADWLGHGTGNSHDPAADHAAVAELIRARTSAKTE